MKVVDTWCILLDFKESIASIIPFNGKCSFDNNMFCQYFLSVVFCFCLNNDIFEIYVWWIFNHLKCYVACIFLCIVSIYSVHVKLGITCMWTYNLLLDLNSWSVQNFPQTILNIIVKYICFFYLVFWNIIMIYQYSQFLLLISCVSLEINITPISC